MLRSKSKTHVTSEGARVEIGTIIHGGQEYTELGSLIDTARGVIVAYVAGKPCAHKLTTWSGEEIAPLTLIRMYESRGAARGKVYTWRCTIDGRVYSGRNSGPGMVLKLRAGRAVKGGK